MRATYIPLSEDDWSEFYRAQAGQSGHGLPGFQGLPYQRGNGLGSLFKGLFRMILPVAKNVGKVLGKEALSTGALIAQDLVRGDSTFKDSLEKNSRKGAANVLQKLHTKLQTGKGRKRKLIKADVDHFKAIDDSFDHVESY